MEYSKIVWMSLIMGCVPIIGKYAGLITSVTIARYYEKKTFDLQEKVFNEIDWKDDLLSYVAYTSIFFLIYNLLNLFEEPSILAGFIAAFLLISLITTYHFLIHPFTFQFRSKLFEESVEIESWVQEELNDSVRVRIINKDIINAYATGVLPLSKTILLGKPLLEKMNKDEWQNLVLHELGHLKGHHLLILFFVMIAGALIWATIFTYLFPYLSVSSYEGLNVILAAAIAVSIQLILFGLVQRQLEYQADLFAAKHCGADAYAKTLTSLSRIAEIDMNEKSLNYPTMNQRINHVRRALGEEAPVP